MCGTRSVCLGDARSPPFQCASCGAYGLSSCFLSLFSDSGWPRAYSSTGSFIASGIFCFRNTRLFVPWSSWISKTSRTIVQNIREGDFTFVDCLREKLSHDEANFYSFNDFYWGQFVPEHMVEFKRNTIIANEYRELSETAMARFRRWCV